jgi:glycosyltransferase involved in cell wall biosynthesis
MRMSGELIHLIGQLELGGAETVLCRLLEHADRARLPMRVVTLRSGGRLVERVRSLGIPVDAFEFRGQRVPAEFVRLARFLRRLRPCGVVTWMYHANLIGGLAAKLAGDIPTVWNVRHAELLPRNTKLRTRLIVRVGGWASHRWPRAIVHVSEAGFRWHQSLGYTTERSVVIANGFDLARFRPDRAAYLSLREEIGRPPDQKLVGLVGRFHPNKDHQTFVRAAAILRARMPDVEFVLSGAGIDWSNSIGRIVS